MAALKDCVCTEELRQYPKGELCELCGRNAATGLLDIHDLQGRHKRFDLACKSCASRAPDKKNEDQLKGRTVVKPSFSRRAKETDALLAQMDQLLMS